MAKRTALIWEESLVRTHRERRGLELTMAATQVRPFERMITSMSLSQTLHETPRSVANQSQPKPPRTSWFGAFPSCSSVGGTRAKK